MFRSDDPFLDKLCVPVQDGYGKYGLCKLIDVFFVLSYVQCAASCLVDA